MTVVDSSLPRRLQICQVLASAGGVGGLEKHVFELTRALADHHDLAVIADPTYRALIEPFAAFFPCDFRRSRLDPRLLWDVGTLLRKLHPAVIHAHANKASSVVQMLRPLLTGRQIATLHGLKKRTAMFRGFDTVIAVSKAVAERLSPQTSCRVIYNGLRRESLQLDQTREAVRATLGISPERPLLMTAGRLVPVKGFDVLLQALTSVDADLLIAGDGPERAALESLAQSLNLAERVRFLGFRTDIPNLLQATDIAVISSRREGFPYFLLEALHLERVIVSTRVPGASEWVPERYLAPVEDAAALSQTLRTALADRLRCGTDFQPLWTRAAEELTFDRMVSQVLEVYQGTGVNQG